MAPARPGYVREKQVNIPDGTVVIKEGAQVTTSASVTTATTAVGSVHRPMSSVICGRPAAANQTAP